MAPKYMKAALIALLILQTFVALADDAYWVAVGSAGSIGKSKDVRMLSEHVQIKLFPKHMDVRVDFEFKNEGIAQDVTMAFPETATDYRTRKAEEPVAITKIWSKVDGAPAQLARRSIPLKEIDEYAQYSAVWLKTVHFETSQRRRVTMEYQAALSPRDDMTLAYYILRSGASWKGNIGRCRITVDWSGIKDLGEPTFSASEAPISDSKSLASREISPFTSEISLTNVEPDFDLEMIWENFFWNYRINGEAPPSSYEVTAGGSPNDPWISTSDIHALLAKQDEFDKADENRSSPDGVQEIPVQGRIISFSDSAVMVNGKAKSLDRPLIHKDWGEAVYVKDLVKALGGTFTFDIRRNRAIISIPALSSPAS